jgi:TRAF3-interacting protein 1
MELESLINQVQNELGALIQKPKMTEKVLSRPPFRFLHDVITAVISTTRFAEGLYNEQELDSATLVEKQQKLDYLDKIIVMLGICQGEVLDISSLKVIQGLEPEKTNAFLLTLARCAIDSTINSPEAVIRTLNGEQPGQGPIPRIPGGRDRDRGNRDETSQPKSDPYLENQSKLSNLFDGGNERMDSKSIGYDSKAVIGAALENGGSERGKSRGGTRGGKPSQQTGSGAGLTVLSNRPSFMDSEIEQCDGNIELTKELMGNLIQRPKMVDKLLAKPPFRFLHDIIAEIIRVTGFASGLYNDFELDSANIDSKESKLEFLDKIINLVGTHLSTLVEAKSIKIVAGHEPQSTNRFLQLLALAAKHMPDSKASVATVLDLTGGGTTRATTGPAVVTEQQPVADDKVKPTRGRKMDNDNTKLDDKRDSMLTDDKPTHEEPDDKGSPDHLTDANSLENRKSLRPTTARRRPPKIQDGSKEIETKGTIVSGNKAQGILIDGQQEDDDEIQEDPDVKGMADDGVGGADIKESKLIKDILGRQAEQEVAAAKSKEPEDEGKDQSTGKGSGIRLGKLRKTGVDKKSSGSTSVTSSSSSGGDIERLRKAVQILVQHTGPLGTCMDYVQEDNSLMITELHRWEDECTKYEVEMESQRQKTQDALKPLYSELNELEEQIKDKLAKISGAKASITKNEERIKQILRMVSTS